MESNLVTAAAQQGMWALLFVALFLWVLKENKSREDKYLAIISTLSEDVKERLGQLEADVRQLAAK